LGTQGNREGFPGTYVLDAGALIALERGDRQLAAILGSALATGSRVFVPASAFAQAWRGGPRSARLARLLDAGEIDPLDGDRAKQVGVRLGARNGSDVVDAHVVCCALESAATVATSDGNDIRALVGPTEHLRLIAA
jgi:hypothetical protein